MKILSILNSWEVSYILKRLIINEGIRGIADKLHTDLDRGLTPIDFEEREASFGSNFKAPIKRTPFCKLFFGALEDFMLRLLLVCACVSIIFDEAFATTPGERNTGIFILFFKNFF